MRRAARCIHLANWIQILNAKNTDKHRGFSLSSIRPDTIRRHHSDDQRGAEAGSHQPVAISSMLRRCPVSAPCAILGRATYAAVHVKTMKRSDHDAVELYDRS